MRVLAVDGGGSGVRAAVADGEGLVAHASHNGGVNPLDNPRWRENLALVLDRIGTDPARIDFAVLGLPATGEVPANDRQAALAVAALLPMPHAILNDVALAHHGAFAGGPGILVLSGTGSMAMAGSGRSGEALARTGGWGEAIGDEGSAHWIGHAALALVSQTVDGRADAVTLRDRLFRHLGLDPSNGLAELSGWYYGQPHRRSAAAALARFVDRAANDGDEHAAAIVDRAAEHLSAHANALRRQLPGAERWPWSHAGGAFASRRLLGRVATLQEKAPQPPALPPLGGGLLDAARRGGFAADGNWIGRLRDALRARSAENEERP